MDVRGQPARAGDNGAHTVHIRGEQPSDATAIEAITVAAFKDAPHTDHTEHFIVRELRRTGALTVSLVAHDGGEIVGHVAVSPVSISNGATRWHGLGPISVLPARQGQGIGAQLMRSALSALRASGANGCVLLGEPGYYARFGFVADPGLVLPGVPPPYFQAIAFNGPLPSGTVDYHAAFTAKA